MERGFTALTLIGVENPLAYQHYAPDINTALRGSPPGGIPVSRLAELARVRKQSMAQAVDQLERTGYVERRENPGDQRSRLVFLTPRGESVPPVTHAAA